MELAGRKRIYTDQKEITRENIISVLTKAYSIHKENVADMQFLFNYERGYQPLMRQKTIRPDINIEVNDNAANYIKEFKIGYFWGQPAMLVQRGNNELHATDADKDDAGISALNEMLRNGARIAYKNQKLAEFVENTGIGHRLVDIKTDYSDTESLVEVHTLDSRFAFCVYYSGVGERKVLGVTYSKSGRKRHYTCFTDKLRFEVSGDKIIDIQENPLGRIPIVEFERSIDRTGCFERQISDMDALNILVSDFTNDVSQRTQEVWWGDNIDFKVDENGEIIKPKSGQWILTYSSDGKVAKIQPLSSTFDGAGTLSAISNRWNRILQKAKVPTQQDSEGGGSTGTAMGMSSGWSAAEVDAMREQGVIENGLREELILILKAIESVPAEYLPMDSPIRSVHSSDVDFHFPRDRKYDLTVKANFMATLIGKGFHGRHVIKAADAFEDAEQVWIDSKPMIEAFQNSLIRDGSSELNSESNRIVADSSDQIGNSPIIDGMNMSGASDAL